jgi:hypothetical protein
LAVARRTDEADRRTHGIQGVDPRLPARRDEVEGFAGQAEPRELLLDRFRRARSVGEKDDAAALATPLLKTPRGTGVKLDAVMNDAPYIAQD